MGIGMWAGRHRLAIYSVAVCVCSSESRQGGRLCEHLSCIYARRDLLVDLGPCMTIDQGGVAAWSKERAGN